MVEAFIPQTPPTRDEGNLTEYLNRMLREIGDRLREVADGRIIEQRHVVPEKPRNGMVVYADGSDWNPGDGEGFYGYENGAWVSFGRLTDAEVKTAYENAASFSWDGAAVWNESGAAVDYRAESDDNADKFFIDGSEDLVQVAMGTASTAKANVGGVLYSNAVASSTTNVLSEEDLMTYTLPANSLSANSKGLRISLAFTTAANTNSKTIRIYFGSTVIDTYTTTVSGAIELVQFLVMRRGASSQIAYTPAQGVDSDAFSVFFFSTASEDETSSIVIKVTGQNGVATAGDITAEHLMIESLE